jgi:hypothetical protein
MMREESIIDNEYQTIVTAEASVQSKHRLFGIFALNGDFGNALGVTTAPSQT